MTATELNPLEELWEAVINSCHHERIRRDLEIKHRLSPGHPDCKEAIERHEAAWQAVKRQSEATQEAYKKMGGIKAARKYADEILEKKLPKTGDPWQVERAYELARETLGRCIAGMIYVDPEAVPASGPSKPAASPVAPEVIKLKPTAPGKESERFEPIVAKSEESWLGRLSKEKWVGKKGLAVAGGVVGVGAVLYGAKKLFSRKRTESEQTR